MNAQDSLQIIQDAILNTKENIRQHSFSFLYWGWLVIGTSLLHFFLLTSTNLTYSWIVWPVFMIIGYIIAVFIYRKKESAKGFQTQIDIFLKYLWIAMGISFFMTFIFCTQLKISPTPFMCMLSGIGTFSSGLIIKHKPLVAGGVAFFIFAIIALFLTGPSSLLVNAAAIFTGFIIPGYLLKSQK